MNLRTEVRVTIENYVKRFVVINDEGNSNGSTENKVYISFCGKSFYPTSEKQESECVEILKFIKDVYDSNAFGKFSQRVSDLYDSVIILTPGTSSILNSRYTEGKRVDSLGMLVAGIRTVLRRRITEPTGYKKGDMIEGEMVLKGIKEYVDSSRWNNRWDMDMPVLDVVPKMVLNGTIGGIPFKTIMLRNVDSWVYRVKWFLRDFIEEACDGHYVCDSFVEESDQLNLFMDVLKQRNNKLSYSFIPKNTEVIVLGETYNDIYGYSLDLDIKYVEKQSEMDMKRVYHNNHSNFF